MANPGSRSGGEIDIFLPGDPSKGIVDRIRDGVFAPDGIFVDTHSNLYVTNGHMSGHESVEMYAKGGHRPIRFYMGALCAFDVIAASDGTVYIADACGGSTYSGSRVGLSARQNETVSLFLPRWYSILPDARCEEQSLRRLQLRWAAMRAR